MNQNPMVFFAYDILKDQPEFAEQFLQHAEIDYYKKGDLVDSPETEEMQRLHLILEGEVECCHVLEGHINKIDMIASAGAFIGMSALDSYTRHHSFICRTNCMIASQPKTAIFDWDKEISTWEPDYYKWTKCIFKKLYDDGLAKLIDMPVNW